MKHLLLLLLLTTTNSLFSQDYFWIGNEGNWSDLTHWAKSSGGIELHTTLPDSSNNIYFDSNSFTMTGQKVFLDIDGAKCKDLTLSDVGFKPTFQSSDYYNALFIHGNLTMTSDLVWGIIQNYLLGNVETNISIKEALMGGFLIINPRDSTAVFNVLDNLEGQQIELLNGQFDTKGFDLNVGEIRIGSFTAEGSPSFIFNDSQVRTSRFLALNSSKLDAGSSEITVFDGPGPGTNLFFGGGHEYNFVNFEGEIDRIKDNNEYVRFTAMPGSSLVFEPEEIQKADTFIFQSDASAPISISSRTEGVAATLEQVEGVVDGNYLILKDNQVQGGAIFNAYNSIDNGNVSGWNIEITKPENYYWVNNNGAWSDLSHWARSSGGSDFHIEPPSAIDNVFFDSNSASLENVSVEIDLEAISINNLSLLGLKSGSRIVSQGGKINIYGDVTFDKDLDLAFKDVEFSSDSIQTLISNGSSWGVGSKLECTNSGRIELGDGLTADDLFITNGVFSSNGNPITCFGDFKMSTLNDPRIILDGSVLSVRSWIPSSGDVDLSLEGVSLSCGFIFYGEGFYYEHLNFTGRNWVYGPLQSGDLEFQAGSEILIFPGDTVKFESLIAKGKEADSITIKSREEGAHAFLYSEAGEAKGEYLIIQDNRAIGGADFLATNSRIDEFSVLGWNGLTSGIQELHLANVRCYPNPANDFVQIARKQKGSRILKVYSLSGELKSRIELPEGQQNHTINTSSWAAGLYILSSENGLASQKLVIQR